MHKVRVHTHEDPCTSSDLHGLNSLIQDSSFLFLKWCPPLQKGVTYIAHGNLQIVSTQREHLFFLRFHTRHPEETYSLCTTSEKHCDAMSFFFPTLGLRWESRREMGIRGEGCTQHSTILPYNNESETTPPSPSMSHSPESHPILLFWSPW